MKEETRKLMARAEDCLQDAEKCIELDMHMVVVNRSYYAAFDAARAMLCERGYLTLKTHSGTHTKFSEVFIKSKEVPPEMGDMLRQLFDTRQAGDYDFTGNVDEADARESLEMARQFLATARAFLA